MRQQCASRALTPTLRQADPDDAAMMPICGAGADPTPGNLRRMLIRFRLPAAVNVAGGR